MVQSAAAAAPPARAARQLAPHRLLRHLQRWGSLAFGDYVDALAAQADEALAAAAPEERAAAEALVVRVCHLENGFWGMAFEGAATE